MTKYRKALPQLAGDLFLMDAGVETDLIFNRGIDIPEFAAHTLLPDKVGREALRNYFQGFLSLANEIGCGYILDSVTWKAHSHWAKDLDATVDDLQEANKEALLFIAALREEHVSSKNNNNNNDGPIVLNAVIGPRGDAYNPEELVTAKDAEEYHFQQLQWIADTDADMVTAMTFTQADEAIGVVKAANALDLPVVISFTVETDGNLPTGQSLLSAIKDVDEATQSGAAYFMVNCAHPDHFMHVLGGYEDDPTAKRIRGIRCNASRRSHAELDECDTLDDGDPEELSRLYAEIKANMPWLNIFGGCCGSDLRHVTEIARVVSKEIL